MRTRDAYYAEIGTMPTSLLNAIRDVLIDEVIKNPEGVQMPNSMGMIKIVGNRNAVVDNKASKEANKKVYNLNLHTDGYVFKCTLLKYKQGFKKSSKFANDHRVYLQSGKTLKKAMHKAIIEDPFKFERQ